MAIFFEWNLFEFDGFESVFLSSGFQRLVNSGCCELRAQMCDTDGRSVGVRARGGKEIDNPVRWGRTNGVRDIHYGRCFGNGNGARSRRRRGESEIVSRWKDERTGRADRRPPDEECVRAVSLARREDKSRRGRLYLARSRQTFAEISSPREAPA